MGAGSFTLFAATKRAVLTGAVNFTADNFNVAILSASYTPDVATDAAWSAVSANEVAGTGYTAGGVALSGISLYYTLSSASLPTIGAGGAGYPASGTFDVTLAGGTETTPAVVNVTTNASGVVTTVNSVTTRGVYSAPPNDPAAVTGSTGTGLTLVPTWDAAFAAASSSWNPATITGKYAVLVRRAGASLAPTDILIGYVDLNVGGAAISSTDAQFQVAWSAVGLFALR